VKEDLRRPHSVPIHAKKARNPAWFKSLGSRVTLFSRRGRAVSATNDFRKSRSSQWAGSSTPRKCYPGLNHARNPPENCPKTPFWRGRLPTSHRPSSRHNQLNPPKLTPAGPAQCRQKKFLSKILNPRSERTWSEHPPRFRHRCIHEIAELRHPVSREESREKRGERVGAGDLVARYACSRAFPRRAFPTFSGLWNRRSARHVRAGTSRRRRAPRSSQNARRDRARRGHRSVTDGRWVSDAGLWRPWSRRPPPARRWAGRCRTGRGRRGIDRAWGRRSPGGSSLLPSRAGSVTPTDRRRQNGHRRAAQEPERTPASLPRDPWRRGPGRSTRPRDRESQNPW
jgi:hypothetical protein